MLELFSFHNTSAASTTLTHYPGAIPGPAPMSEASKDDKDQSRRERGKLAQREYRKRHASTFQNLKEENQLLKEENQMLKDAIRQLSSVAATLHPCQIGAELGSAISRARDAAGVTDNFVTPDPDNCHIDMLFPVSEAPPNPEHGAVPAPVGLTGDPLDAMAAAASVVPVSDPGLPFAHMSLEHHPHPAQQHQQHQQHQQQQHHHHAHAAQTHHQIHAHAQAHAHTHAQHVQPQPPMQPPTYEPAYFGQDMFTLAGRLFWDCMTYNFLRMQRLQAGTAASGMPSPNTQNFSMSLEDQEMVAAMARVRLQYKNPQPNISVTIPPSLQHHDPSMSRGHIASPSYSSFPVGPVPLHTEHNFYFGRCARSVPASGGAAAGGMGNEVTVAYTQWWKTPAGVEEFVRQKLTVDEYRLIQDPLLGHDLGQEGENKIRTVMQALVPNAIYFPEGPRWSFVYLNMVLPQWIRAFKRGDMHGPG